MPDMLPIDDLLSDLRAALTGNAAAVLQAAPGAGKTTGVPPALLDAEWLAGRRILMLEPRRLAARAAARFMAAARGETVGETVGYRVRMDARVGPNTRIEVVTEGVLTRMLQSDPELVGYGLVIFDEFHERSLQADLGLALVRDVQQALRPDLKILVMSATLDVEAVADLLGDAPVLHSAGRQYPVELRYRPQGGGLTAGPAREIGAAVAKVVREAVADTDGSLLVFLPGVAEIRDAAARLADLAGPDLELHPLYGNLGSQAQDRAIAPAPDGVRKIVLATAIAQTSLTIEGITVVVDAGWSREAVFDPGRAATRLVTRRVSRAAAEQRRGRAGRLASGVCYRLWSEQEEGRFRAQQAPEILQADLTPLVLELAGWGVDSTRDLALLDRPPAGNWAQAQTLLHDLGALDDAKRITAHGRAMLDLPLPPRLAHMLLAGRARGAGRLAGEIAALLSEGRLPSGAGTDLEQALRLLREQRGKPVMQLARRLAADSPPDTSPLSAGALLSLAYPDRIARRRGNSHGRFQLGNGRGAVIDPEAPLAAADWLVVADLDDRGREARIRLAGAAGRGELESLHPLETREIVAWSSTERAVVAERREQLGALVLECRPLDNPAPEAVQAALLDGLREAGLESLPWTPALRQWQARVALLRSHDPDIGWPAVDDTALLADLEDWLLPFLTGMSRLDHLARLPLGDALVARLDYAQQQTLRREAPEALAVPSGHRRRIDYGQEEPVLAVKLQELFGWTETPRIAFGRVPVLIHLLSPAGRPVQVTRDLHGFWERTYAEVRKELKGRYPKHYWPEDPWQATPTARVRPGR